MAPEKVFASKRDPLASPEAFENEIPTYRAVSAAALASAICGLLSGLAFVSYWWLLLSVFAIVLGAVGIWRIRSMPDTLTGRGFAHAGLAMGLIFGVTSFAYDVYSMSVLKTQAFAFGTNVIKTFNNAKAKTPFDPSDILWWMMPPHMRKGKVPEDARPEIAQLVKDSVKVRTIEDQLQMMASFAGKEQPIEILAIEDAFYSERDAYATLLLKVGGGRDHSHDAEMEPPLKPGEVRHEPIGANPDLALLVVHGMVDGQTFGWYVEQLQYPYTPKSFKVTPKKPVVDDGHGHAH